MEICVTESRENSLGVPSDDFAPENAQLDEFVLDLSSLSSETDYVNLLENIVSEDRNSTAIRDDLDTNGNDRRNTAAEPHVNPCENIASISSGYESDIEDEIFIPVNKRRRFRKVKYRQEQYIGEFNLSKGNKRKNCSDDDMYLSRKRIKVSSSSDCNNRSVPDACSNNDSDYSSSSSDSSSDSSSCSWSSSDSVTSSDSTSSDSDTQSEDNLIPHKYFRRIIQCPDTCVCNAGQSRPPAPIERENRTPAPLYKKLLQHRMFSVANTALSACCKKQCYLRWIRQRSRF